MEERPKRVSRRTPGYMANAALGTRLNKVGDGVPVISEYYDRLVKEVIGKPEVLNMSHIPINVTLGSASIPLPLIILEEVIRRSPHRVITRTCQYREAAECKNYPCDEFGCIHIGLPTEEHNPSVANHATVEETIAYLRKAVA